MNENQVTEKKRNLIIDVLRGLCIILVILGHTNPPIVAFIYVFHVPVFFILSGFTSNLKNSKLGEFIIKRFVSLIIPFLGINIALLLFRKFLFIGNLDQYFYDTPISTYAGLKSIFQQLNAPTDLGGATWFLVVLFWSSIFAKIIYDSLANKAKIRLPFIILGAFAALYPLYNFWSGQRTLPLSLDLGLLGTFYYLLGFYIHQSNVLEKIKTPIGLSISLAVIYFFGKIRFASMNWPTRSFDTPLTNVLAVLAGFYITYQVSILLLRIPYINKTAIYIGKKTVYALSLHFLGFKLFYLLLFLIKLEDQSILKAFILPFNNPYWIYLTIFASFFSFILAFLFSKAPLIDFVFTGKYKGNYDYINKNVIFSLIPDKNSVGSLEQPLQKKQFSQGGFLLFLAIFLSLVANYWVITPANGFAFDDYSYLYSSQFHNYSYTILPVNQYNDRPVGQFLIYTLLNNFGMNYVPSHFIFLVIHLINVMLVFYLSKEILNWFNLKPTDIIPFLAAVIFGVWSASTMCVQWLAAAFDLLGATFFVSGLLLYFLMKRAKTHSWRIFYAIVIPIIFFLGLRTKEMTITLPVIIFLFEAMCAIELRPFHIKPFWREPLLWILLFMMSAYGLLLRSLSSGGITTEQGSPYLINLSPLIVIKNFIKYQILYFDLTVQSFTFQSYTFWALLIVIVLCLVSLYLALKENILFGGLYLILFVALLPVLPLQNMQHRLYLYIPSIFFAIILSGIINSLTKKLTANNNSRAYFLNIFLAFCILSNIFIPSVQNMRNYWKSVWSQNATTILDIKAIHLPLKNSTIYVTGINNGDNVFIYGPGFINNIIFNDKSLKTVLESRQDNISTPYLIWQFQDGRIIETERKN